MSSRFVGATLVVVFGGAVLAGEVNGLLTKYDAKDGVTLEVLRKGGKGRDEKTFKLGKGVKITKGDDTLESKDLSEMVAKATDPGSKSRRKGVPVTVTTDDEGKITLIEILPRKRKAKDK